MKLLTGLFRAARKRILVTDNDSGAFRSQLMQLVEGKDTLDENAVSEKVEALKKTCEDLPESDKKAKLLRYLEDFKALKEQDAEVVKNAAEDVAALFEELDKEAAADAPNAAPAAETTGDENGTTEEAPAKDADAPAVETKDEEKTEAPAPATETKDEDEKVEEVVEETEEPKADGETKDEDPSGNYSLEEIYQFIKKRMSEDAGAEDEACEETKDADPAEATGEAKDEDTEKKLVGDSAPVIPVTLNNAAAGGLAAIFKACKGE